MIAALLLLLVTATAAPDASMVVGPPQGQPLAGAALDAKTQEVASLLRCPVCQGMSVADSPSEMAVNMKHQVGALLARGYTGEQILDYFERSYGQFVLLKPKFQGVNTLVWVLPILAIAIGVVIVFRVISRRGDAEKSGRGMDTAPHRPGSSPSSRLGMTWVALAAAVVAVGAWYVVQPKPAPPEPQPVAVDPVKQLEATIQESPDNLAARVELARLYFDRNHLMGVFEQTQYVLERSPDDSRALTYQAFVRISMGQRDNAVKLLAKATALDPGLTDAWIAMAWIKTRDGLPAEAQAAIAEAARRHPEERARLERVYADMQQ
ncbi:MAG: cytochrome c-type biogenesis protein CcmH [Thermoanaerobaculia bacterium]